MKRFLFWGLPLLLLLALCALGAEAFPTPAREERLRMETRARAERLALQQAHRRAMEPWRRVAEVVAGALLLGLAAGLGSAGVRYLHRRAAEIHADENGLFPLLQVRQGGVTILHDPNRALTMTTLYASPERAASVVAMPVIAPGLTAAQVAASA